MKPIKDGGGVYVYRTRKPMSFLGKFHLPEWTGLAGALIAGTAGYLVEGGAPWWMTAPVGLLLSGRHFAYVGETKAFALRHRQHMGNIGSGDTYEQRAKPWADLDPRCVLRLRLPRWKWLLRSVETLIMVLTWPVYNDKKNRWNPRRVPLVSQRRQRFARDRRDSGVSWNFRAAHVLGMIYLIVLGTVGL